MCGINGIVRLSATAPPVDRDELVRTRERLATRGPDGAGLWMAEDGRIGLGHRRLAILDLSDAGAQPMATADGRYRVVFNGEIYNFRELRDTLEAAGHRFRSTSDTEVVLALYAREGRRAFSRLRGMYALAIWDSEERCLCLARDRFGIKPLYYAADEGGESFRFASQVKALDASGAISPELDPSGLAGFLLWGSVPAPWTVRRGVRVLPAGCSLTVSGERVGTPEPIAAPAPDPEEPGAPATDLDWPEALDESVRAHLVSDVPVAVFLSSGLDSGTIAALACRHLTEPPVSFTLRFETLRGTAADEGPLAAAVAGALGTHHVERTVGQDEMRALWPAALDAMDQPSIDGFNTYLVSRAAHQAGLKVVLSGLGGDELLGSYPSFTDVPRMHRWLCGPSRVPGLARAWSAAARRALPRRPKLRGLLRYGGSLAGSYFLRRGLFLPEEVTALLAPALGRQTAREAVETVDPVTHASTRLRTAHTAGGATAPWYAVQALERSLYMRNQLLRDADWASMAHSLELRVPLVDAWLDAALSPQARAAVGAFRGQAGKAAVLRRVAPELPDSLWTRPKSGFYIPVLDALTQGSEEPRAPKSLGSASRHLALRVLEAWGVELESAAVPDTLGRAPA